MMEGARGPVCRNSLAVERAFDVLEGEGRDGLEVDHGGFDVLDFSTGQNDRHVTVAFGANHAIHVPEFAAQGVPEEEKQGIKGLVLTGRGDTVLNGQGRKEAADFVGAEFAGRSAADEGLDLLAQKR